jgi:hypothetical protein
MVAERREYTGGAVSTTLNGGITSGALSATLTASSGWPSGSVGPFTAVIDPGLSNEEKVKVSTRSGNILTISARGVDGSAASAHSAGAVIQHVLGAYDLDLVNAHAADTTRDDHTQYLHNSNARTVTAAHVFSGNTVHSGNPTFSGTPAFTGVPTFVAGSYGLVGDITQINATAKAAGTSPKFARADHRHDIDPTWLKANSLPTGLILMWGLDAAIPSGYLELAGATFDPVTYPELHALYPSNTLPDFRTRVPRGVASGATGTTGGADTVTLVTGNLPAHVHTINHGHAVTDPGHTHGVDGGDTGSRIAISHTSSYGATGSGIAQALTLTGLNGATTGLTVGNYAGDSGSTGSGTAIDIVPKWIGVRYIIKAA